MTETKNRTPDNGASKKLNLNMKELANLISVVESRSQLATRAGKSYGNDRNIYRALGYKDVLTFEDFWSQYIRGDIAKRIVEIFPTDTWRLRPAITENAEKETEFEKQWEALVKERKIFHYLSRADKLSGIGSYSVLLMGFDDVDGEAVKLEDPVTNAKELLFLRPFKQDNAAIHSFVSDITDERYGLPEFYNINLASSNRIEIVNKKKTIEKHRRRDLAASVNMTKKVHWSRILHVAEDLLEDDVFAVPRLQPIFNILKNLELVVGGSGEMFWRGAYPGIAFKLDKDAQWDASQDSAALEEQIQKYFHNLQRQLTVQGMEVDMLSPTVADPSKHFQMFIAIISATIGVPTRILLGTERGELASSQDERAWNEKVEERRLNYAEPMILRQFIDRLQMVKILPETKEDYTVVWPPLKVSSEKEKAETMKLTTESLAAYANSIGASDFIPFEIYAKEILKLEPEIIEQINAVIATVVKEEDEDAESDAAELDDFRKGKRKEERDEEFDKQDN